MRFLSPSKTPKKQGKTSKKAASRSRKKQSSGGPSAILVLKAGIAASFTAAFLGAGLYAWMTDMPGQAMAWAETTVKQVTEDTGFVLKEVYVVGRSETDRDDVLAAIGVTVGEPLFGFNPVHAKENLEALGWVKTAEVRRVLPDTITVHLQERVALAIWQRNKTHVLIDQDGVEIGPQDVNRHRHLKVLVGPDAPGHAADLLRLLGTEPELNDRVIAAQRVGQRRWNLHLESGIDVRLPEEDLEGAWRLLAEYQRDHEILSRAIGTIDLRQRDRITVKLTEPGMQEVQDRAKQGEDT